MVAHDDVGRAIEQFPALQGRVCEGLVLMADGAFRDATRGANYPKVEGRRLATRNADY
jgi:hypothetical protein